MNLSKEFKWELTVVIAMLIFFSISLIPPYTDAAIGLLIISVLLLRRIHFSRRTSMKKPFEEFKWELTIAIVMLFIFSLGIMESHPLYGSGLLIISLLLARRIRFTPFKKSQHIETEQPWLFRQFRWELAVAVILLILFSLSILKSYPIYGSGLLVISFLIARRLFLRHPEKRTQDETGTEAESRSSDK